MFSRIDSSAAIVAGTAAEHKSEKNWSRNVRRGKFKLSRGIAVQPRNEQVCLRPGFVKQFKQYFSAIIISNRLKA